MFLTSAFGGMGEGMTLSPLDVQLSTVVLLCGFSGLKIGQLPLGLEVRVGGQAHSHAGLHFGAQKWQGRYDNWPHGLDNSSAEAADCQCMQVLGQNHDRPLDFLLLTVGWHV